ncbi:MAG: DnaJ domain-containing protein [Clostridiales bacterium]|nr:DnaJ domain-containing protein [Clostridiales bacterium]
MRNPYEVLQVSENASDAEIKEAYRKLARRYQEEGSERAQGKLKELDEAYDTIILSRSSNGSNYSGQYSSAGSDFGDIRAKIKSGRYEDALTLLDGIPTAYRNAEWHYLKGTVFYRQGWLEEAEKNISAACAMDPGNPEYNAAYQNINSSKSGGYRTERTARKNGDCSACDLCSTLLCADCCCECMGGDLIKCC